MSKKGTPAISDEVVMSRIHTVRGQKVMLDSDLAELYDVPTKALKQAVRRNLDSFPADFMFELAPEEWNNLRSHFVTSSLAVRGTPPHRLGCRPHTLGCPLTTRAPPAHARVPHHAFPRSPFWRVRGLLGPPMHIGVARLSSLAGPDIGVARARHA